MTSPVLHRARRAWSLLRARTWGGSVVLLYHRIARPEHDPFELCVTPGNFADHMAILARVARPVRLDELSPAQGTPLPGLVAVTFDDAYEDVLTEALPVLERYRVPATVFVVSGAMGAEFWWDRMSRIPIRRVSEFMRETGVQVPSRGEPHARKTLGKLHAHLLGMDPHERDALIRHLCVESPEATPLPRTLNPAEVRRLHVSEQVEIGAHTRNHPSLATMTPADQEEEILSSRQALMELLNVPITSFAYPFGTLAHYSRMTAEIVKRVGFERACTAEPGIVTGRGSPFELPRLWVGNWTGREFERRLMAWLR